MANLAEIGRATLHATRGRLSDSYRKQELFRTAMTGVDVTDLLNPNSTIDPRFPFDFNKYLLGFPEIIREDVERYIVGMNDLSYLQTANAYDVACGPSRSEITHQGYDKVTHKFTKPRAGYLLFEPFPCPDFRLTTLQICNILNHKGPDHINEQDFKVIEEQISQITFHKGEIVSLPPIGDWSVSVYVGARYDTRNKGNGIQIMVQPTEECANRSLDEWRKQRLTNFTAQHCIPEDLRTKVTTLLDLDFTRGETFIGELLPFEAGDIQAIVDILTKHGWSILDTTDPKKLKEIRESYGRLGIPKKAEGVVLQMDTSKPEIILLIQQSQTGGLSSHSIIRVNAHFHKKLRADYEEKAEKRFVETLPAVIQEVLSHYQTEKGANFSPSRIAIKALKQCGITLQIYDLHQRIEEYSRLAAQCLEDQLLPVDRSDKLTRVANILYDVRKLNERLISPGESDRIKASHPTLFSELQITILK